MDNVVKAHREQVGAQIKAARQHAGLSHDVLAGMIGSSRQHLIKLEKGQHLARPEMLAKISTATGQPLEFFRIGLRRDGGTGLHGGDLGPDVHGESGGGVASDAA